MAKKTEENVLGFEAALKRLEEIVASMESGEVDLDTMIALFEEGQRLVKQCSATLNDVEKRIEKIVDDGKGGVAVDPLERAGD
ncbi:MAG: exodeoxyribonuclease VII small subunit [Kiritimatiellae bacterium]|nr:exodeoxyribonuclease VII small subunit [Kiritimatiellia bacterium]NLF99571.1 exodeoxyribonuclease VII small subunit [Lentisphaerota bacterium]